MQLKIPIFILLTISLLSCSNENNYEIGFVDSLCLHGMESQTDIPVGEIEKFCNCATKLVEEGISTAQRQNIADAEKMMDRGERLPEDFFEESGLRSLVSESQDTCANSMWPVEPSISDEEHEYFSNLANDSVENFTNFIEESCKSHRPSPARDECLSSAASEWVEEYGKMDSEIPEGYITGSYLAEAFITK